MTTDELIQLRQAAKHRLLVMEREDSLVDEAVLAAYRATRDDGTPEFTLVQIGEALGVTKQRAHQIVREASARESHAPGRSRTAATAS